MPPSELDSSLRGRSPRNKVIIGTIALEEEVLTMRILRISLASLSNANITANCDMIALAMTEYTESLDEKHSHGNFSSHHKHPAKHSLSVLTDLLSLAPSSKLQTRVSSPVYLHIPSDNWLDISVNIMDAGWHVLLQCGDSLERFVVFGVSQCIRNDFSATFQYILRLFRPLGDVDDTL